MDFTSSLKKTTRCGVDILSGGISDQTDQLWYINFVEQNNNNNKTKTWQVWAPFIVITVNYIK